MWRWAGGGAGEPDGSPAEKERQTAGVSLSEAPSRSASSPNWLAPTHRSKSLPQDRRVSALMRATGIRTARVLQSLHKSFGRLRN